MAGIKGRSGRKPKWTDEQIEEAADDLLEWLQDPEHIWFKDWAVEANLPPEYLSRWAAKNPVFRQAMETAEMTQESRLVNGGLKNKYNARIVALVLEAKHTWAARQNLTVTEESSPKSVLDAIQHCMPEDREEAREWLQSLTDGQGEGQEAEVVRVAARQQVGILDMLDQANALATESIIATR